MTRSRLLCVIGLLVIVITLASGCVTHEDLDERVEEITGPYRFDLAGWEFRTIAGEIGEAFRGGEKTDNSTEEIITYFTSAAQIKDMEAVLNAVSTGDQSGDPTQMQNDIDELREDNEARNEAAERALETLVREALAEQGIYHPADSYLKVKAGFPPVKVHLGSPPHLLIVSPRDRIESVEQVELLPVMKLEDVEKIESEVDGLGVSSIVEGLGGLSTYPSYVNDNFGLAFAVETAVHEWMHQYLAFTPLGIRYLLDQLGIKPDDDIATINETVAGIVSREIGDIIIKEHFPQLVTRESHGIPEPAFDFYREMRETRIAVDAYLAQGEIETAEEFMEQKRLYLAENGYYLRKLNQAYFAFHGAYADSPTSVSPIGTELRQLRGKSDSLKEFLASVVGITSREELAEKVK